MGKRREPSYFHDASDRLFDVARMVLRDQIEDQGLKIIGSPNRLATDEFEGIGDYGTVGIRDKNSPSIYWFNFGFGWDLQTYEEIQFIIRWRPTMGITLIETDGDALLNFDELIEAMKYMLGHHE